MNMPRDTIRIFLSTLSLRRATNFLIFSISIDFYFYPRSPCGERLWPGLLARPFFIISIHALLAESDCGCFGRCRFLVYFYPRSPCGERPLTDDVSTGGKIISIHALLAESDSRLLRRFLSMSSFLSTLSLRRATASRLRRLSPKLYFYPRSPCGERLTMCILCSIM